ncbi:hypothetical protein MYK68_12265 [Gordonia sp. PP30]|uniref:hypothetical protein n=2 Tax=Gordonia TaxID=2053 RepID=UPI001FFF72BB|nr:hypothetical protein [Gordonia sp. PP30]UQE73526.1 hypothetical protein MYK68_12265 [Gordonia sp. PP30]
MDLSGEGPDPRWLAVSRAHVRGLRGRYRQHVVDCTGEGHAVINGWLRGATLSRRSADYARSRTASLDAVLAAIPLTRAMHVTRVVGIRATFGLNDGHDLDRIVGQPRMEAGFLSTSRMRTYPVKNRADPILLDVDVPAGTRRRRWKTCRAIRNSAKFFSAETLATSFWRRSMIEMSAGGARRCWSERSSAMSALDSGELAPDILTDIGRIASLRQSTLRRAGYRIALQPAEREAGLTEADIWRFLDDESPAAS